MANAIIHSRPPSYRSHNSDHEVVTPQLDGNNVPERDQQTFGNQVLSTTAEINAIDNTQPNYISTSTHSMPNQSAPDAAQNNVSNSLHRLDTNTPKYVHVRQVLE